MTHRHLVYTKRSLIFDFDQTIKHGPNMLMDAGSDHISRTLDMDQMLYDQMSCGHFEKA